jgi:hypothetical protein
MVCFNLRKLYGENMKIAEVSTKRTQKIWILIIVAVIDEIIERTDTNIGTRFGHNVACLK